MVIVVLYTYAGGMWAVSITDFVQTILILFGIIALAWEVSTAAGGVGVVLNSQPEGFFRMIPERNSWQDWAQYVAAWITIGLGSIPGQDVFQRVNSARNEQTAVWSSYLGGALYLTVGLIPLFIGLCARQLHPELLAGDPQQLLPVMALKYSSFWVQVLFFGALLSAILSTTSGAILAPATVLGENIIQPIYGKLTDRQLLLVMRFSVVVLAFVSMFLALSGQTIFEMVSTSSALSLVSLFVPLMAGLYWPRANAWGAMASLVVGLVVWTLTTYLLPTEIPGLLYGLAGSTVAMVLGTFIYEHCTQGR
jgi:Na+/proline symporter